MSTKVERKRKKRVDDQVALSDGEEREKKSPKVTDVDREKEKERVERRKEMKRIEEEERGLNEVDDEMEMAIALSLGMLFIAVPSLLLH